MFFQKARQRNILDQTYSFLIYNRNDEPVHVKSVVVLSDLEGQVVPNRTSKCKIQLLQFI